MRIPTDVFGICPKVSIADIDIVEGAAGPGRRLVVWLQGCLKRCPGCANQAFLPLTRARVMAAEELLDAAERASPIAGVTLSGGEPALQADALVPILSEMRSRGLNVMMYAGYTLEELKGTHAPLLRQVDLLVDGEFRSEMARGGRYRPSGNQRIHFLSDRLSPSDFEDVPDTVFAVRDGHAAITGTLPADVISDILTRLRARGVVTETDAPDIASRHG